MKFSIHEKGKPLRQWCVFHGALSGKTCSACIEMWKRAAEVANEVVAEADALRERREAMNVRRKMA